MKIDTSDQYRHAIAETLDGMGDKWTVLVVGVMEQGPLRYDKTRCAIDGVCSAH